MGTPLLGMGLRIAWGHLYLGWGWELLRDTFTWGGVGNCLGTLILGIELGIAWEHPYLGWVGNC